jgi:lipid-A-disaccharide synthase
MRRAIKLALIAGEPSGDVLGAALIRGLKREGPVELVGLGGPLMQAEGLHSHLDASFFAVNGFTAVLRRLPRLLAEIRKLAAWIIEVQPDLLVTIDSPALSLRLARQIRQRVGGARLPLIQLVAPTVWAWKPERAALFSQYFDGLLTLFPFEPPYFEAAGLSATFVGHPLATRWQGVDRATGRAELGWGAEERVLLVLPGSRSNELRRLLPTFGATVQQVLATRQLDRLVMPTLNHLQTKIERATAGWPMRPELLTTARQRHLAFAAGNIALVASGTAAMELAAAGTPAVVSYSLGWLNDRLIAPKLRTEFVSIVNIMAKQEIQPEYIGARCRVELLAPALARLLDDPAAAAAQVTAAGAQIDALRPPHGDAEARLAQALWALYESL